jgi:acetyl-CoA carboxylase carboxyltransferase component
MDAASSRKGVKVIDQAHRLGLPLVFLTDMPGFIVGKEEERLGLLSAAMDYLRALISAQVPKISLVLRKAYGFGYFAMGGPGWGGDYVAALPSARIAFMGPEPGINLIYQRQLDRIADPEEREARKNALLAEWAGRVEPWEAAYAASIDDVIQASEARHTLIRAVRTLDPRGEP